MNTVSSPECLSSLITTFKSFLIYIVRLLLKDCGPWERYHSPAWPAFEFSHWFLIFSVMTLKNLVFLINLKQSSSYFYLTVDFPFHAFCSFFPFLFYSADFKDFFRINVILRSIYLICCKYFSRFVLYRELLFIFELTFTWQGKLIFILDGHGVSTFR